MKSRTQVCCIAVCLVAATVLVVALRARSTASSNQPTSKLAQLGEPRIFIEPAPKLAAASLWNPALPFSAFLSDGSGRGRILHENENPLLPTVQEFGLTPPNPSLKITKTTLSVRFPELAAEQLASSIPMLLSKQHVVLQRSADDPTVFSTLIDFDWQAFAREQQQRKEAADKGWMVPMFEGRQFIGNEKMQFVDPSDIEFALQNHQSMHFSRHIFEGTPATILPNKELMVTDLPVVGDVTRTWDPCTSTGNPNNPWTFKSLMVAIRNKPSSTQIPIPAEQMLDDLLNTWTQQQTINTFLVPARPNINTLLADWPTDSSGHHSLDLAPVRLNAIVNRIDLGQAPNSPTPAGELRFVFGVNASAFGGDCHNGVLFNIILEYNVPASIDAPTWALQWGNLANLSEGTAQSPGPYQTALQAMTDQVVKAGDCPTCTNGSAIHQLRTNEIALGNIWEQREFHLDQPSNPNELVEATIAQTPDGSYTGFGGVFGNPPCSGNPNGCTSFTNTIDNFITLNQLQIDQGTYIVPLSFQGRPFRGGSAFNGSGADAFWNGEPSVIQHTERVIFSLNTCNACHGRETQTFFQQVVNRSATTQSGLSNFLLGTSNGVQCSLNTPNLACTESVSDPVLGPGTQNIFGDIARRVVVLQGLLPQSNGPNSGGMFLPFNRPHISFVH